MKVTVKNDDLKLFKEIMGRGFVIGNGSETESLVRELKRAKVPIQHGYAQETKKVVVALERPFTIKQKQRTLAKTVFELRSKTNKTPINL